MRCRLSIGVCETKERPYGKCGRQQRLVFTAVRHKTRPRAVRCLHRAKCFGKFVTLRIQSHRRETLRKIEAERIACGETFAWPRERLAARDSLRFYLAQGLAAVALDSQGHELAEALSAVQAPDGSWAGLVPDSCEDEPLLATAFAVRALLCLADTNG